jgi:RNA polymerase sigma factor (sigma-70 family)
MDIRKDHSEGDEMFPGMEGEIACLRLRDGDESAMETLIALYWESLQFFIGGYVRNFSDAEDLTLETFIEFTASLEKFSGRSSVKTYLFSIGRNRALMFLRKHKNESKYHHAGTDSADKNAEDASGAVSAEADFLKDEQNRRLHAAMKELKEVRIIGGTVTATEQQQMGRGHRWRRRKGPRKSPGQWRHTRHHGWLGQDHRVFE